MKKYSVNFIFLILAAGLIIFGACGSGEPIDLTDRNSPEYQEANKARTGLANEGGLITHCKDANADTLCQVSSSSKPESSSSEEEFSSSGGETVSSSSEEPSGPGPGPSSSSAPAGSYEIPPFTCYWAPNAIEPGGTVQIKVEFNPPNAAAEGDCRKKAWVGISIPNEQWGTNTDKYDTATFEIGKNIQASGVITADNRARTVQWPVNGEFKSDVPKDDIAPNRLPSKIVRGTVSCEKPSAGKNFYSIDKDCETLRIGSPSSSSSAPSSSSLASSSSALSSSSAGLSSSSRSSSSSLAPSSSSRSSSSSLAPSSSSRSSSSSLAPSSSSRSSSSSVPPPPPPSSSSNSTGAVCGAETAVQFVESTHKTITTGLCMKYTCSNGSRGLRLSEYNNSKPIVKLTGGCSVNSYEVPNKNEDVVCTTNASNTTVYIEVINGSGTNFQIGCW